ncbi:DUF5105 domain-containing protein [Priestia megaterium]|nr:DUF5105 domain-containing protein [Priestia megaterium]
MKKVAGLALTSALTLALAACSGSKETSSSAENKAVEVSIEKGSYILANQDDGTSETEKALLAVGFKVKNTSDSSISISSYDGVQLYDGDEQLAPKDDIHNKELDLNYDTSSGKIGSDKVKTFTYIFEVEKDKEYEIGIQPRSSDYDEEIDEVTLKLDTKKYAKSYNKLEDPAKALKAYTEVLYLNKENADYEKYVSAEKEAVQEEAKKAFREQINRIFTDPLTEEASAKLYDMYKNTLKSKGKVEMTTAAHANGKAVVHVDYTGLRISDLYDIVSDYKKAYYEETGDFDTKNRESYAISKFNDILNALEPKESERPLEILMVEKDGKWSIQKSDRYSDTVTEAFAEGNVR